MCSLTGLFSAGHLWLALLCYHLMKWLSGLQSSLIPQRGGGHPLICIVLEMLYMVLWFYFHMHSTVERMGRLIWWHIGIALLM